MFYIEYMPCLWLFSHEIQKMAVFDHPPMDPVGGLTSFNKSTPNKTCEYIYIYIWFVVYLLLWKIWVRQLGLLFQIYEKIQMFQTTNQIYIYIYVNSSNEHEDNEE